MNIGVPKEIKADEYRVGLTPKSVASLTENGHSVFVEHNAGFGIGYDDKAYQQAGAIVCDKNSLFAQSELIIKVKEPLLEEIEFFNQHHTLFTYLHLAANKPLTEALITKKVLSIAYETVTRNHRLPLLQPMSAVAGRLSVQAGARALEKTMQGAGILLGGVSGVAPANVVIIGGGTVGNNAAQMALGLGANVTILDKNIDLLAELDKQFSGKINVVCSSYEAINQYVKLADLLIGSVLIPGASAPKIITRQHIKTMKPGSVVVDVAIDQGGCFETSKATTHQNPTFVVDDIVHYCVANMPGAVPKTATEALNNATLPYILELANLGIKKALKDNLALKIGVNLFNGHVVNQQVAQSLNLDCDSAYFEQFLSS